MVRPAFASLRDAVEFAVEMRYLARVLLIIISLPGVARAVLTGGALAIGGQINSGSVGSWPFRASVD